MKPYNETRHKVNRTVNIDMQARTLPCWPEKKALNVHERGATFHRSVKSEKQNGHVFWNTGGTGTQASLLLGNMETVTLSALMCWLRRFWK